MASNAPDGSKPGLVVWLLMDQLDIDSKQVTFVAAGPLTASEIDALFARLYKWMPASLVDVTESADACTGGGPDAATNVPPKVDHSCATHARGQEFKEAVR